MSDLHSQKWQEEETLKSLREEYSKLSSLMEKYLFVPYSVLPLALTVLGALTLYGNTAKGLWGVVIIYGMVLLLAWQCYIHIFINGVGLRLVELECRINALTKVKNEEGLHWCSLFVGQGIHVLKGFWSTTLVVFVFGVLLLMAGSFLAWRDLNAVECPARIRIVIIAIPTILLVVLLCIMRSVDKFTRKKRNSILKQFINNATGMDPRLV
jgi:hypothetical protein